MTWENTIVSREYKKEKKSGHWEMEGLGTTFEGGGERKSLQG